MWILYVEDNVKLAQNTCASLQKNSFTVDVLYTGEDAIHAAKSYGYEAIFLDLGLPDMDCLSVFSDIKSIKPETPVIICTARGAHDERLKGLNPSSDGYFVKPFKVSELIARIKAALGCLGGALGLALQTGNILFQTVDRSVKIYDTPVKLSKRELDLLELFMQRKGRIQSKGAIESSFYGFDEPSTLSANEAAAHRLRKNWWIWVQRQKLKHCAGLAIFWKMMGYEGVVRGTLN